MELFDLSINSLNFSNKVRNALIRNGIEKFYDFEKFTIKEISMMDGIGKASLSEIRETLKLNGIKLKKNAVEKKEKKERKYSENTKEILINILGVRINNFALNMKMCGKMIEAYGEETMRKFKVHDNIDSLFYYFSNGEISPWVDQYVLNFAPVQIIEKIEEIKINKEQLVEKVEYIPMSKKPKSLSEFLGHY